MRNQRRRGPSARQKWILGRALANYDQDPKGADISIAEIKRDRLGIDPHKTARSSKAAWSAAATISRSLKRLTDRKLLEPSDHRGEFNLTAKGRREAARFRRSEPHE